MKHIKLFEQFLNEGYGVQAIDNSLKAYAESNDLIFKKVNAETKKGSYGSNTTFTVYQLGSKFIVVKNEKVAGAPRFNSVKVFITETSTLDGKALASSEPYDEYELKAFLGKHDFKGDTEVESTKDTAAGWSKEKLTKELKELKAGYKDADDLSGDDAAFDIADGWIYDNPGVDVAIKKHFSGVSDIQGFVANWIA
jgi:hypothetical protein